MIVAFAVALAVAGFFTLLAQGHSPGGYRYHLIMALPVTPTISTATC